MVTRGAGVTKRLPTTYWIEQGNFSRRRRREVIGKEIADPDLDQTREDFYRPASLGAIIGSVQSSGCREVPVHSTTKVQRRVRVWRYHRVSSSTEPGGHSRPVTERGTRA